MAAICVRLPISLLNTEAVSLTSMVGIFIFHPTIPNYPKAKFPGVVVFSEIYQGRSCLPYLCISRAITSSVHVSRASFRRICCVAIMVIDTQ